MLSEQAGEREWSGSHRYSVAMSTQYPIISQPQFGKCPRSRIYTLPTGSGLPSGAFISTQRQAPLGLLNSPSECRSGSTPCVQACQDCMGDAGREFVCLLPLKKETLESHTEHWDISMRKSGELTVKDDVTLRPQLDRSAWWQKYALQSVMHTACGAWVTRTRCARAKSTVVPPAHVLAVRGRGYEPTRTRASWSTKHVNC